MQKTRTRAKCLVVNRNRAKFARFKSIIMKKLLYISLLAILLSASISCSRSVDKRLVLADTLMWTNPDSSLAILNTINRDSLQGDENQAYYALLLTQAQFRCNIPLTSDTLISKAVDYYSDNHNREHYTRSLLYKGGYYEFSANQPVEAIKWFKQAEDNADTTDYRNLAQINMRLAMLYFKHYASNNLDLEKFKKSLYYYEKLHDKRMSLLASMYIASLYRITRKDTAELLYDKAQALAIELKDSSQLYQSITGKALLYLVDSSYVDAKDCMLQALSLSNGKMENSHYFILSEAYSKLGLVDSSEYYFNKVDLNSCNSYDSVMFYRARKELAIAKGDFASATKYENNYLNLTDSLEHNKEKYELSKFESDFDNERIASKAKKVTSLNKIIYYLVALFLVFALVTVALIIVISRKKRKDQQQMIDELKEENFGNYEELRSNLADFDNHFSKTMNERLKSLEEIMTGAYNPNQDSKSSEVEHKISPIADDDTKFWEGLYAYINIKHNGAMDRIANDYPQLSASDLNFIKLMCCGFSDAAIAVCRNYRNVASVRGRRRKIRDKMGIEGNLTDYIRNITVR